MSETDLHARIAQLKTESQRLTAQVDKLKGLNGVLCDEINEKDRRIRRLETLAADMGKALGCPSTPCVRCFEFRDECDIPERMESLGIEVGR